MSMIINSNLSVPVYVGGVNVEVVVTPFQTPTECVRVHTSECLAIGIYVAIVW